MCDGSDGVLAALTAIGEGPMASTWCQMRQAPCLHIWSRSASRGKESLVGPAGLVPACPQSVSPSGK
eukprot:4476237-Alexandrium_andersonii.AAC.1